MVELGNRYSQAQGVQRNLTKAIELYHQAADLGDAMAMYNLGVMYEESSTMVQACQWFSQAKAAGNQDAQVALDYYGCKVL